MQLRSVLIVILVVFAAVAPAAAQEDGTVSGRPNLSLSVSENHFTASQQAPLNVHLSNNGDLDRGGPGQYEDKVKTARNVKLEIKSSELQRRYGDDIQVKSGTVAAGTIPEGSAGPFTFQLELSADIKPGQYKIPVRITYDYTNWIEYSNTDSPRYHDNSRVVTKEVTIVVEDRPRFKVMDESSQHVLAGDTGIHEFTVKNVGTDPAYDADVTLTSNNPSVFFGNLQTREKSTSVFIDQLDPGETTNVTVQAGADPDAVPRTYPISAVVNYMNENQVPEKSNTLQLGIGVGPEQTFSVDSVESTLRVGDDGAVSGTVVNNGPDDVSGVVVVYKQSNPNLHPRETEYAVGTLKSGESAPFEFRVDTSSEAEAGPRVVSLDVRYRNHYGDLRTSDPIDADVAVAEETDEFRLEVVDATVTAGSGKTIAVRVTNTANQTLTDIEAKMFTDDPLSSNDDEAYISKLDAGESTEIKFNVNAASTALAKEYPVSIDFSYEDARSNSELSDTYRIPVTVEEAEEKEPPMGLIAGAGVAVMALLIVWKRDSITSRFR